MSINYPLEFSADEMKRLDLQSESLKDTRLQAVSKNAKNCLEIGCGTGSNILVLRESNPNLKYLGIDSSNIAIDKATKVHSDSQTEFLLCSAENIDFKEEFDLVVIRLVLWSAETRELILEKAFHALKEGGVIYCYEPDDSYIISYPPKKDFDNLVQSWRQIAMGSGSNPFIGRELPSLLSTAGFTHLKLYADFKAYHGSDPVSYKIAVQNLLKLFGNKCSDSQLVEKAENEMLNILPSDYISEGYISTFAEKRSHS